MRVYPFIQENVESIEILLGELDYRQFYLEKAVLSTYCNVILKNDFVNAQNFLKRIIGENPHLAPAMLCLCLTNLLDTKSVDKETLKEITKLRMNPRWGDDSERAWLHVADFLMQARMYDKVEALLKKCLKVNRSSMKALEMMGMVYERQENFVEAAKFYNYAWDISEKRDCAIGYRIASLQFKCQNFVQSIQISKQVILPFIVLFEGFEHQ